MPLLRKSPATSDSDRRENRIRARSAAATWKRAVAVAQEDRDVVGEWVGDGQVEMAVGGEVPRHDRVREAVRTRERDRRQGLKCPVAVTEQNGDAARALIGHGQVDRPVAREVARGERVRAARHRDRR